MDLTNHTGHHHSNTDKKTEERKHYRPGWDDYFMAVAKVAATRGTCNRLYAGAVLVKSNRIIATGYNGSPPGLKHCDDVDHLMEEGHCVRTIHAEHNVLLQAAVQGSTSTLDSTMYTKYSPCIHCTKYIIAAGVKRIVIGQIYRNENVIKMLNEAGVQVDIYQENEKWNKEVIKIFEEGIPKRVNEGKIKLDEK